VPVNVADDAVGGEEAKILAGAAGGAFREGVSPCESPLFVVVIGVEGVAGGGAGTAGVPIGGAGGAGPGGGAGGDSAD